MDSGNNLCDIYVILKQFFLRRSSKYNKAMCSQYIKGRKDRQEAQVISEQVLTLWVINIQGLISELFCAVKRSLPFVITAP